MSVVYTEGLTDIESFAKFANYQICKLLRSFFSILKKVAGCFSVRIYLCKTAPQQRGLKHLATLDTYNPMLDVFRIHRGCSR